jgi:hypothetical protein
MKSKLSYSKEVESNHKETPKGMGGNSSPESGTLNQISIKRWRFSFIKGRLHRLIVHQSSKEALGLVLLYSNLGYLFTYTIQFM